jgi:hypothetical protein
MRWITQPGDRQMATFQIGKTYTTRSVCDHDCIITVEVVSRTAKAIKAKTQRDGLKSFRIRPDYNGNESISPWGSYSMAPVISADRMQA